MDVTAVGSNVVLPPDRTQLAPTLGRPPAQAVREPDAEMEPLGLRQVELAVEQLNRTVAAFATGLQFILHEGSGRMMVRVIDPKTGDVLREHPPRKILDTLVAIREAVGMLFDKHI